GTSQAWCGLNGVTTAVGATADGHHQDARCELDETGEIDAIRCRDRDGELSDNAESGPVRDADCNDVTPELVGCRRPDKPARGCIQGGAVWGTGFKLITQRCA